MKNLKDFETDLQNFIKEHSYLKEQNALIEISEDIDSFSISIQTTDGDYERIEIKVNYIS